MAKKQNINNNDPISQAIDLLLENNEDLTTVFKEGCLYKELTKRLVKKNVEFWNAKLLKIWKKINIVIMTMHVMV